MIKTVSAITARPGASSHTRWLTALRGVLLLAFGLGEGALVLLAFRLPNVTARGLVLVIAAFLIGDGVVVLVQAWRDRGRWWPAARAVAGLAAGALLLATASHALAIFAWWAVITGALEASEFLTSGRGQNLVAALSVGLGLFVLVGPVGDPVRLLLVVAIYGLVAGALRLGASRSGRPGG